MIGSNQKLLMARAGVKAASEPFTFLGGSSGSVGAGPSFSVGLPASAEVGATWIVILRTVFTATFTLPSGFQDLGFVENTNPFHLCAKTLTQDDIAQGAFTFGLNTTGDVTATTALYASCTVSSFTTPVNQSSTTTSSIVATADGRGILAYQSSSNVDQIWEPSIMTDVSQGSTRIYSDTVLAGGTFGPYEAQLSRSRVRSVLVLLE